MISQISAQSLPDKINYKSGSTQRVIITNEDAEQVFASVAKGVKSMPIKWEKIFKIEYGNISNYMKLAESYFENKSWERAIKNYKKVLMHQNSKTWEKTKASFFIGLSNANLGKKELALNQFIKIKKNSRWFYPSKLKIIKALPDNKKNDAIQKFITDNYYPISIKKILSILLFNRLLSQNEIENAKTILDKIKDKKYNIKRFVLDELEIKINVANKAFKKAAEIIEDYIDDENETGAMRVSLGDIYINQNKIEKALYEYLRAKVSFKAVASEASYKAGKTFLKMIKLDKHKSYAKKELRASIANNDGLWSIKSKNLYDQLK